MTLSPLFQAKGRAALLAAASMAVLVPQTAVATPASARETGCDRACLTQFTEDTLNAFVGNKVQSLPWAVRPRYTEDGQELMIGDGLWRTATSRGSYKHLIVDVKTGQVGFFVTMRENGKPVLVTGRIEVIDRTVAAIELIVARDQTPLLQGAIKDLEVMRRPEAVWAETLPQSARRSRGELLRIANLYFTGMENNKPGGDYSFFSDDCDRLENGMQTTNRKAPIAVPGAPAAAESDGAYNMSLGCKAQYDRGAFQAVTRIRDRRLLVVDEEKGLVFGFAFFDHQGSKHSQTLADGRVVPLNTREPFTWEVGEAFKITEGRINRVEAVFKRSPYGMPSGWETAHLGYDPRHGPQ